MAKPLTYFLTIKCRVWRCIVLLGFQNQPQYKTSLSTTENKQLRKRLPCCFLLELEFSSRSTRWRERAGCYLPSGRSLLTVFSTEPESWSELLGRKWLRKQMLQLPFSSTWWSWSLHGRWVPGLSGPDTDLVCLSSEIWEPHLGFPRSLCWAASAYCWGRRVLFPGSMQLGTGSETQTWGCR